MSMNNNNQQELIRDPGLEEHIVCPLCHNFFSDAVTLERCLHSFCRKCLQKCPNFSSSTSSSAINYKCPKCFVDLGPEPAYRRDQKLQEMTYKLIPDLLWRQIRKQARRQHRRHASGDSPHLSERRIEQRKQLVQLSTQLCSTNEKISIQIDYVPLHTVLAANEEREEGPMEIAKLPEDPSGKHSFRRFLRCPSKVRIEQLRKLLELKLAMTDVYGVYFVDPTLRDVLEDEYSLEDLIEMFNWSRDGPFQLRFTLSRLPVEEEEEEHPPILEEMPQLDVESGPMERPKHQQEQSPTKVEEEKAPKQQTNTTMNIMRNKMADEKKETTTATLAVVDNGNKKDEAVPSTSSVSISGPSLQRQKVTPTSPPTANKMPIPRLSTAGVSPLRPVPSLLGAIPTLNGGHQQQPQTAASKKRKRNSSTAGEKQPKFGGQSPAQKMLKFGPNLKTNESEENPKMMMTQPPALAVENEMGQKKNEMSKIGIGEEGKEEEKQPKPTEQQMIPSTSSTTAPLNNANAKDISPSFLAQTTLPLPSPFGQKPQQKEKKKRPPANPKPKATQQNSLPKMPQNQTKMSPPFAMGLPAQSISAQSGGSHQSMVGGNGAGSSQINFNPPNQQFGGGSMPILAQQMQQNPQPPQQQQQQQFAAAQLFQNLLQNSLQTMSPQQVQQVQAMMAMVALAGGAIQQQSQQGGQPQKAMTTPTMQSNKMNNNKGMATAKQSNGTTKTLNNRTKLSPPKMGATMLAPPSASSKPIQQQKIVVTSSSSQPSISINNSINNAPNILNSTMITTVAAAATAMKATMPS